MARPDDILDHVRVGSRSQLPADFQIRVAMERLGIQADPMPGGLLVALSRGFKSPNDDDRRYGPNFDGR